MTVELTDEEILALLSMGPAPHHHPHYAMIIQARNALRQGLDREREHVRARERTVPEGARPHLDRIATALEQLVKINDEMLKLTRATAARLTGDS